ncbi:hypothetical protein CEXT_477891 [Caerostris extrusa]|uniref:Uncharacterized protein n=1 Tax=Caerostris extrusa TaxID=172846 RepID=A0AAV4SC68_CAEEX|nr:hypothetical protein CEXT_477891 [Caerostris extrusa]
MIEGQPNQEIHQLIKARQLVSAQMPYVGMISDQRVKRSIIVIQYWYPSDDGSGPMETMWIWQKSCISIRELLIEKSDASIQRLSRAPGTENFNKVALAIAKVTNRTPNQICLFLLPCAVGSIVITLGWAIWPKSSIY